MKTKTKRKPLPQSFARGNKAASKGEPRTVSLTVRLPASTARRLAEMAYGRCTRADMIIGLIKEAAAHSPTTCEDWGAD